MALGGTPRTPGPGVRRAPLRPLWEGRGCPEGPRGVASQLFFYTRDTFSMDFPHRYALSPRLAVNAHAHYAKMRIRLGGSTKTRRVFTPSALSTARAPTSRAPQKRSFEPAAALRWIYLAFGRLQSSRCAKSWCRDPSSWRKDTPVVNVTQIQSPLIQTAIS